MPLTGPILDKTKGQSPENLVIFFHGYGASGENLLNLGDEWADDLGSTIFLAPDAPIPMGHGGYQWYEIYDVPPETRIAGLHTCLPQVHAYIDAQMAQYKVPANRTALVGFSQGGSLVLQLLTERPEPLGAIVSYAGFFLDPEKGLKNLKSFTPTLLVHGEQDTAVPFQASVRAQETLSPHGPIRLEARPHLGHSIDPKGSQLGCAFLKDAFDGSTLKK